MHAPGLSGHQIEPLRSAQKRCGMPNVSAAMACSCREAVGAAKRSARRPRKAPADVAVAGVAAELASAAEAQGGVPEVRLSAITAACDMHDAPLFQPAMHACWQTTKQAADSTFQRR